MSKCLQCFIPSPPPLRSHCVFSPSILSTSMLVCPFLYTPSSEGFSFWKNDGWEAKGPSVGADNPLTHTHKYGQLAQRCRCSTEPANTRSSGAKHNGHSTVSQHSTGQEHTNQISAMTEVYRTHLLQPFSYFMLKKDKMGIKSAFQNKSMRNTSKEGQRGEEDRQEVGRKRQPGGHITPKERWEE